MTWASRPIVYEVPVYSARRLAPPPSTVNEKNWLSFGKSIYQTNCISCHKTNGSGLVGPNLTDDHYKNVKNIEDVYTVIANGAAGGAMPAWKTRLSSNEMVLAAAYASSLRGTPVPETAKPPEGALIPAWPTLEEIASRVRHDVAAHKTDAIVCDSPQSRWNDHEGALGFIDRWRLDQRCRW